MSTRRHLVDRIRVAALVCADAASYVLVVTTGVTLLAVSLSLAAGYGMVGAKTLLFLIGFVLLGYATLKLWPSSIDDVRDERSGRSLPAVERSRMSRIAARVPPARWLPAPDPTRRLSPSGKLFWTAVAVLAVSLYMEVGLGIV
ncbi:hypothetical protein JCM17823_21630 [Halorubrum gandharaense]